MLHPLRIRQVMYLAGFNDWKYSNSTNISAKSTSSTPAKKAIINYCDKCLNVHSYMQRNVNK